MACALRSGNQMVAQGALAAGCNFFSGYPITPSSAVYAEMMRLLPARGGVALGAPDEISALSYAVGASLTGARAMTATSGPGWSLMVETVQYALMTETPVVIVVVQRLGPATGGATQGAQGDVLFVEYANSGGYPIPVLAPVDARDCHTLTAEAFRLAEVLRSPVVVLSDKETAMTTESVDLSALPEVDVPGRVTARGPAFVPYAIAREEDVPAFAPVGGPCKVTVTGSAHNERGELRKNDPETLRQLRHLAAKVEARAPALERVRSRRRNGARTLLVSYGVSARTCRQVAREGPVHLLEVLSLFPVPRRALEAALDGVDRVVIVEENRTGLYARELRPWMSDVEVRQVNGVGAMIGPAAIREALA
ncbi:MAG: transketolase C-terminal domain-containing protein [Planctomycetota bacterium]|jgi:2-oxoglutarate ferredoxin oxidoreductase subunit alpha